MIATCTNLFTDFIVSCGYFIKLNAVFVPATLYTWIVKDKFGHEYSGEVTTDEDGGFYILTGELPEGLFNPFAGSFTLRVMDTECQYYPLRMMSTYEGVEFEIRGGTRSKVDLGCDIDCTISGTPSNSAAFETFIVDTYHIDWTSEMRSLYGNTPQVQVFQKLSNGVYTLVSVEVIWNGTDGLLDSLDIDFGGNGNFLVIVRG